MCLMCIPYLDSCSEPECVEAAKEYVKTNKTSEAYYSGRTPGYELFLWQGYGEMEPCKHMLASHGPDCPIFDPDERICECYFDKEEGVWKYYL